MSIGFIWGAVVGTVIGAAAYGIGARTHRTPESQSLPPMQKTRIPDSVQGPVERVRGFRVFQAGDCTVWRFQDSVGIHYLAEGRVASGKSFASAVSCAVAR